MFKVNPISGANEELLSLEDMLASAKNDTLYFNNDEHSILVLLDLCENYIKSKLSDLEINFVGSINLTIKLLDELLVECTNLESEYYLILVPLITNSRSILMETSEEVSTKFKEIKLSNELSKFEEHSKYKNDLGINNVRMPKDPKETQALVKQYFNGLGISISFDNRNRKES